MCSLPAIESFLSFIEDDGCRFYHRPFITEKHGDSLKFRLSGITPDIQCTLTPHDLEVHAFYRDTHWDILEFFDMPLVRIKAGRYHCGQCDLSKIPFYDTIHELFTEHCFEPFLRWVNKAFHERSMLFFFESAGATWVKLRDDDLIGDDSDAKDLIGSVPAAILHPGPQCDPVGG